MEQVGGVSYTVKDGVVYNAKALLADVRAMVKQARPNQQLLNSALASLFQTSLVDTHLAKLIDERLRFGTPTGLPITWRALWLDGRTTEGELALALTLSEGFPRPRGAFIGLGLSRNALAKPFISAPMQNRRADRSGKAQQRQPKEHQSIALFTGEAVEQEAPNQIGKR